MPVTHVTFLRHEKEYIVLKTVIIIIFCLELIKMLPTLKTPLMAPFSVLQLQKIIKILPDYQICDVCDRHTRHDLENTTLKSKLMSMG